MELQAENLKFLGMESMPIFEWEESFGYHK